MDKISNMLNPHDKLVGTLNAFSQHQKNNKVSDGEAQINSVQKNSNDMGVELVLSKGDQTVKVTYTKEDLIKNIKTLENEGNEGKNESVIYINLDLENILSQESVSKAKSIITAGNDPYTNNNYNLTISSSKDLNNTASETPVSGDTKLNPLQVSLITADDLELNLAFQMGNDTFVVGNNSVVNFNTDIQEDNGKDVFIIGNNSHVSINSNSLIDNSDDTIIVGNNSEVSISSNVGIDNGNDSLIIGNNSKITIDSNTGIDNSNDTIIVGNNSELVITSDVKEHNGNDTIILGNNAKLNYTGSVGKSNGSDTIIIGNNSTLNIDGNADTLEGNNVIVLGNNVKINMKFNIKEDFENRYLFVGKDKNEILKELEDMGKRLSKFHIGKTSLKDIIDETIDKVKEKLKNIHKFDHVVNTKNDTYSNLNYLDLAMYRYFNRQLSGIDLIYSYANKEYTKHK